MVLPGYLPSPYWTPYWICTQHPTCQWSPTSCDDMELPHTKGHISNPWNKCLKRGLLTRVGKFPLKSIIALWHGCAHGCLLLSLTLMPSMSLKLKSRTGSGFPSLVQLKQGEVTSIYSRVPASGASNKSLGQQQDTGPGILFLTIDKLDNYLDEKI